MLYALSLIVFAILGLIVFKDILTLFLCLTKKLFIYWMSLLPDIDWIENYPLASRIWFFIFFGPSLFWGFASLVGLKLNISDELPSFVIFFPFVGIFLILPIIGKIIQPSKS